MKSARLEEVAREALNATAGARSAASRAIRAAWMTKWLGTVNALNDNQPPFANIRGSERRPGSGISSMDRQMSDCEPSKSVNPYSRAS